MIRIAIVLGALAALAGCGPLHHRSEEFSRYYGQPAAATRTENVERRKILHVKKSAGQRPRLGFLERNRIQLEGSRDWREFHYILNEGGTDRIGFINEDGGFYRYDRQGKLVWMGEYKILDTGLKLFFGLPLSETIALEAVDPYRD